MKKIFTLSAALLLCLSACSNDTSSKTESTTESIPETSAVETTETETVLETTQAATISSTSIPKSEKLNLGKTDEWSFNSRSKFIYFTDYGRYYPIEKGGRNSANYVLCLDRGSDQPRIVTDTEDYNSYYCDGNDIYIYKIDFLNNTSGIYKLENDSLSVIKEVSNNDGNSNNDNRIFLVYFTENYIYYFQSNKKLSVVYRMDYDGNNTEHIADIKNDVRDFAVYDDKIWYDYNTDQGLAYYDLTTGETGDFDKGQIGIINNGYMYYTYYKEEGKLLRFNLSSYEYEVVCEAKDNHSVFSFDFYGDNILYSSGDSLYRLSDNENTPIFSTKDFFDNEGYYIDAIQCQDDRIFLEISCGAFYQCIMEVDIDGNIIKVIHEDLLEHDAVKVLSEFLEIPGLTYKVLYDREYNGAPSYEIEAYYDTDRRVLKGKYIVQKLSQNVIILEEY